MLFSRVSLVFGLSLLICGIDAGCVTWNFFNNPNCSGTASGSWMLNTTCLAPHGPSSNTYKSYCSGGVSYLAQYPTGDATCARSAGVVMKYPATTTNCLSMGSTSFSANCTGSDTLPSVTSASDVIWTKQYVDATCSGAVKGSIGAVQNMSCQVSSNGVTSSKSYCGSDGMISTEYSDTTCTSMRQLNVHSLRCKALQGNGGFYEKASCNANNPALTLSGATVVNTYSDAACSTKTGSIGVLNACHLSGVSGGNNVRQYQKGICGSGKSDVWSYGGDNTCTNATAGNLFLTLNSTCQMMGSNNYLKFSSCGSFSVAAPNASKASSNNKFPFYTLFAYIFALMAYTA